MTNSPAVALFTEEANQLHLMADALERDNGRDNSTYQKTRRKAVAFDVAAELVEAYRKLRQTDVVSDDFPAMLAATDKAYKELNELAEGRKG